MIRAIRELYNRISSNSFGGAVPARNLEMRLNHLEYENDKTRDLIERLNELDTAWRQHWPALLSTATSVAAERAQLQDLKRRMELLEFNQVQTRAELSTRNQSTLVQHAWLDGSVRLANGKLPVDGDKISVCYLGPMGKVKAGFINVGSTDVEGLDFFSTGLGLPIAFGRVDTLIVDRFLETIEVERLRKLVLPYWFKLLRVSGTIKILIPDLDTILRQIANGKRDPDSIREMFSNGNAATLYWPDRLVALMETCGFAVTDSPFANARRARPAEKFENQATPIIEINATKL